MNGYNSITVMGNVTYKPQLKTTATGKTVLDLGVACTTSYGKGRKETLFIDAVCWGRLAEHCASHLDKGARVLVEGHLTSHEWLDKETQQKRKKMTITANTVLFVTRASGSGSGMQGEGSAELPPEPAEPAEESGASAGAEADEVPF